MASTSSSVAVLRGLWRAGSVPLHQALGGSLGVALPGCTGHTAAGPPACVGPLARSAFTTHAQARELANALSIPAQSLAFERAPIQLPAPLDNRVGHALLTVLGFYSHKSKLLHGGQQLYDSIKEQVDDGALIRAFNMDDTVFFSTYTLLSLHVWLIIHRLGPLTDRDSREFKQRFYEHFQNDVQRRVHHAGVQVGVGKWLKKLETVFYASGIALDKVLTGESKETFTEVVLFHYLGGDSSKKAQAALIAHYLQRELHCLQLTPDDAIMAGHIRFSRAPFDPFRTAAAAAGVAKQPTAQAPPRR